MTVELRLLGEVRARVGECWIEPPADKRLGLLGYLACAPGWVDRDRLAWLFWPDVPSAQARTNLRGLLRRAKGVEYADGLEAEPKRLRWNARTDAAAFREALEREDWRAALELYRGTFFGTSAWDAVGEFGAWIAEQREELRSAYRRAALAFAASRAAARSGAEADAGADGDAEAIGALDAVLKEDPFDEQVARAAIAARAAVGRSADALRQAESLRARLRDELHAEPEEATERLIATIGEANVADTPKRGPSSFGAPVDGAALTPFVGRRSERSALAQRLTRDTCRLMTITGPGGVGKTRLARQLAHDMAERFDVGAFVVELSTALSVQDVMAATAGALGLQLAGDEAVEHAIEEALSDAEALLVLDEMEGVVAAGTWLADLLSACAGVTALVTSRRRLDVPGEWVTDLTGLDVPEGGALDHEVREADAVRLFADAAARAEPRFVLDDADPRSVARICRAVGGLPLALELAAPWVRSLPLHELADELEAGIDLLERTSRDQDRHQSVRAAFEISWQGLEASEAEALAALSVFRGAVHRDAAEAVAGAGPRALATLVDRSLLRLDVDGRYECHPLVRAFAREKLRERPELERRAREQHVNWFATWMEEAAERFERTPSALQGHEAIVAYADLLDVLDHAVASEDAELAARCARSLHWYWAWRGRWREAKACVGRVRRLPLPAGSRWGAVMALLAANVSHAEGNDARTVALLEDALEMARARDDASLELHCLNDLAVARGWRGEVDDGLRRLDEGLANATASEYPLTRSLLLANEGALATIAGSVDRARDALDRALAMAGVHEDRKVQGLVHLNRGRLERDQGDDELARAEFQRASELLSRVAHVDLLARVRLHLALSEMAEGDLETAATHLDACLTQWWEAGLVANLSDAVRAAAAFAARSANRDKAAQLWRAAAMLAPDASTRLLPSESGRLEAFLDGVVDEAFEDGGPRHDVDRSVSRAAVAETVVLAREVVAGPRLHVLRVRGTSAA